MDLPQFPPRPELGPELYRELLDNLSDGVYMLDTERRIIYWNRGAERLSGFGAAEVIGKRCADNVLQHVDCDGSPLCDTEVCPAAAVMRDGTPREERVFLHHREGHRVPVLTRISPIRNANGRIVGAVEIFSDNSAELAAAEELERLRRAAILDHVTGIGNRGYGEHGLGVKLDEMARYGWGVGVAFVDVDRFKAINDEHGHDTGDRVLRMVSQTLARSVRSFDLVCRWGGEEFLMVLVNITADSLHSRLNAQRELVASSRLQSATGPLSATVSIGATMARPGETALQVVARADALMFEAKSAGRNRIVIDRGIEAGMIAT